MPSDSVFDDWRHAETAAHEAEHRVFELAMQFLEGRGQAPTEAQWEHSRALRAEADKLFQLTSPPWAPQTPAGRAGTAHG